ncbi:unnamed protein product [Linum trigynum]|uniref:Uncharacterized protein n=1 Tax=Linum trigynum TaxID=586398 RepID=A0AAV2GJG2_9ROSI
MPLEPVESDVLPKEKSAGETQQTPTSSFEAMVGEQSLAASAATSSAEEPASDLEGEKVNPRTNPILLETPMGGWKSRKKKSRFGGGELGAAAPPPLGKTTKKESPVRDLLGMKTPTVEKKLKSTKLKLTPKMKKGKTRPMETLTDENWKAKPGPKSSRQPRRLVGCPLPVSEAKKSRSKVDGRPFKCRGASPSRKEKKIGGGRTLCLSSVGVEKKPAPRASRKDKKTAASVASTDEEVPLEARWAGRRRSRSPAAKSKEEMEEGGAGSLLAICGSSTLGSITHQHDLVGRARQQAVQRDQAELG